MNNVKLSYLSELTLDIYLKNNFRIDVEGLIRADNLCSLAFHKLCAH